MILKEKKNREWSVLEALKDVVASISSRFRRESKPGVNLEKLVEQMENHEVKFKCRTTGGRYIRKVHVESFRNKCNTICLASSATDGRSIAQQPPAHDVMSLGNRALNSGLLDAEQTRGVESGMGRLNGRWNALNIDAIEKELR